MLIKGLILGLLVGSILVAVGFFYFFPVLPHALVGRFLDGDVVYMRSGLELRGRITKETPDSVLLECAKDSYSIPRVAVSRLERNYFFRYLRKAI